MGQLSELREKRDATRQSLQTIFGEAKTDGGEYDFKRVKSIPEIEKHEGHDRSIRVAEVVDEKTTELNELCEKIEKIEAAEKKAEEFAADQRTPADRPALPSDKTTEKKSIGQQVTGHEIYKKWQKGSRDGQIVLPYTQLEVKTLLASSTGFPPESTRTGRQVDILLRPLQVMDIMPRGQTGSQLVIWMGQDTRTQAAAEIAEGDPKPEAAFAWSERNTAVKEIAVFLPVTDVQLEDVPMMESLIETQLREDMEERLDRQVIVGDGLSNNLEGILNVTGIQTQAAGADPVFDAILKAGTKLRTGTDRATPTHVLLHPNDWQGLRLTRTADGIYILGNPADQVQPRVWGWPVVENEALSEGTGLIGGFAARNVMLVERRGIVIERGFINQQFRDNQQSIRGSMRAALAVFRPAAFATITGI